MKVLMTQIVAGELALATLLGWTSPSPGQGLPAPIPAPVDQPGYAQVKVLIDRLDRCTSDVEVRQGVLSRSQGMFFLTEHERNDYLAQKRRALEEATVCQQDSRRELLEVALPKLEAECIAAQNRPCAQWARNQRLWRLELESLRAKVVSCNEDRARAALLGYADRFSSRVPSYEQDVRDKALVSQQMAALTIRENECVSAYAQHILALQTALSNGGPAIHDGPVGGDRIQELMLAAQTLVGKLGPGLTFDDFHQSLSALTAALREEGARQASPNPGMTAASLRRITPIVDILTASDTAWARERNLQANIKYLTQERDTARAAYTQRHSEISKMALDVAEQNLKQAIGERDRASQDRAVAWRTAEKLAKDAPDGVNPTRARHDVPPIR